MPERTPTRLAIFRELLAASPLPTLAYGIRNRARALAVNQLFSDRFGYGVEDLAAGELWWSRAIPDARDREQLDETWSAVSREARRGGLSRPVLASLRRSDGKLCAVEFHLGVWAGYSFALCNDVTARRQAEAELDDARAFLQRIVDTSPSLIFVVDASGRVIFANRSIARYYGTTPEALTARSTQDVHTNAAQAANFVRDDLLVIQTGEELIKEELNTAPDGSAHWFHTVKVPLVRPDGRVECLGISTDITARKLAEQAKLQLEAEVLQSQKLESLGVLAGGIAHDFNNLLAPILSNARLAEQRLSADSSVRPLLRDIQVATARATQLTQQMLAYVGQGRSDPQTLSLADVVAEMQTLLGSAISKKATLLTELEPAVVDADLAQMHHVIMNLITNASDSLGVHSGRIIVRTGVRELQREALESAFLEDAPPAGRYAFLEVEDEGCGMTSETLTRIFEPFFSTKFTGRGLGLSAVLGIARAHRGTVQVSTRPGNGTRFVFLVPESCSALPAPLPAPAKLRCAAHGTVLVIDDERLVRTTLCMALEDAGFQTLPAADGEHGLELFERHAGEISAVVLDLTMPRLDGWECLQRLRRLRAGIPVVVMSGYAAQAATPAHALPPLSFLKKPFDPDDLLREVSTLLALPAHCASSGARDPVT